MLERPHLVALVTGLWLLLVISSPASAMKVQNLYEVAVPVASQSNQNLLTATREGLSTVFIRVSGHADVVKNPAISAAINQARNYTTQFRYETRPALQEGEEQLVLQVEFEQLLVDQQLRAAGLPLWSNDRPSVLVWMVVDDVDGRRFASSERDAELLQAIVENTDRRGLALKLPTLDLEDMVAVSTKDVWQLNPLTVRPATERYQPDSLLLGRATKLTNGQLLGRWSYYSNKQQFELDGNAGNVNDYIAAIVDKVADMQALQYAIRPVDTADGGVLMRLTGINSFVDYARAIKYLESVSAIRYANVISVADDEIILRLQADGLLRQLQQSFALGKKLQIIAPQNYQGEYAIDLHYQWPG